MSVQMTTAEDRLARILADPNLRGTTARWLAHADAHPKHREEALAEAARPGTVERSREIARTTRELRDELVAKAPDDTDLIAYCDWVLGELDGVA